VAQRKRKRTLRGRLEIYGVSISLFDNAGWFDGYHTITDGRVEALECRDAPVDVIDLLDSYGIHGVSWAYLGSTYVYW